MITISAQPIRGISKQPMHVVQANLPNKDTRPTEEKSEDCAALQELLEKGHSSRLFFSGIPDILANSQSKCHGTAAKDFLHSKGSKQAKREKVRRQNLASLEILAIIEWKKAATKEIHVTTELVAKCEPVEPGSKEVIEVPTVLAGGVIDHWRAENISLLALTKVKGLGFNNIKALCKLGNSLQNIVRGASKEEFAECLKSAKCRTGQEQIDQWFEHRRNFLVEAKEQLSDLRKLGTRLLHQKQDEFPKRLRDAESPPQWLFVRGELEVFERPMLGAVGTRKPSEDGLFLAKYIGLCLPLLGSDIATVSGLAVGIDQIIHLASVKANVPTVAVLGTGILADYPHGTAGLKKTICDKGGALITEYFPHESYGKENFVLRNRLQAALSKVLIPVEWAAQSGTAHTVRFAGVMKRDLVCLRLAHWDEELHSEFKAARDLGGSVFTIPGDENLLLSACRSGLNRIESESSSPKQLNMFADLQKKNGT